jgi:hypothetical protein
VLCLADPAHTPPPTHEVGCLRQISTCRCATARSCAGAGYIHSTPSFRRLFPGLRLCTLSASVLSVVLIIRDIGQWLGVRVVKRRTFVSTLREGRSVLVIPGGQAELVLTYRMFRKEPEYAIYTRHKGARAGGLWWRGLRTHHMSLCGCMRACLGGWAGRHACLWGLTWLTWRVHLAGRSVGGTLLGLCWRPAWAGGQPHHHHSAGLRWGSKELLPGTTDPQWSFEGCRPPGCLPAPASLRPARPLDLAASWLAGFVRIAIEEGASLVPMVTLGEVNSLGNLIDWPAMQRWTYKRLGFPLPFVIAGKYGVLPLPAKTGLR